MLIMFIVGVFTVIKWLIFPRDASFMLWINSLAFFSRVTIRNTFHEGLQNYYRKSNRINIIFYTVLIFVVSIYILMKSF